MDVINPSYKLNTIILKAKVELLFMEPYTIKRSHVPW